MSVNIYSQNLKNAILNSLAPIIEMFTKEVVLLLMAEVSKKDKENAQSVAIELYPVVSAKFEEMIGKTDSDLDDARVRGVISGLEIFAEGNRFELPNIDED